MSDSIDFKYRAFLSYSHADTPLAKWLHSRLEGFPLRGLTGRATALGPVPRQLRPIFRDREDFSAGGSLNDQSIAALDASAALVVLCSPASAKSHYVNEEIRLFKHRHPGRPIVPVILAGKPDGGEQECFAPALRFELDAEGLITDRPASMSLAADVREEGDGRDLALAKVAASLIGVPSDEVYRRAERERKRQARIRNAVAAFILLLAITGGYFGWQWRQGVAELTDIAALVDQYAPPGSSEAQQPGARERLRSAFEAIAKGTATDPRYKQALDLIKAGKLQEAEPLVQAAAEEKEEASLKSSKQAAEMWRTAGGLAGYADPKRAREYYAKAAKLDPDNIHGLMWHAQMEQDAGDLAEAERAYSAVLKSGVRSRDDHDLLWASLGLGDILKTRGNLPEALKAYQDAVADGERLIKAAPDDTNWQRDLSAAYEKVGDVLKDQGNLPEALKAYRDSLAIRERLAKADPGNAGWQRDLSVAYEKVGDVLKDQGNLPEALKAYRDSLAIAERLAKADPGNAGWQRDLSVAYEKVGDVLKDQGNLTEALKAYRDSLAIAERLAKADPGNAEWQRDLSVSYKKVGDVLKDQGNLPEALKAYRDSLAICERLAKADPGNAGWQRDLSVAYEKVGDVLKDQGNLPEALKAYRDSLAIGERLAKADPGNAGWQRDLSVSYEKVGDVLKDQGNLPEALKAYRDSLAIAERLAKADPGTPHGRRIWRRAMASSGSFMFAWETKLRRGACSSAGAPSLRRSPKNQGIRAGSGI